MLYGVLVEMVGSSKVNVSKALLSCMFLDDVFCSYRKDGDDFRPMERCFKCKHYLRFLREMQEEEEKFFAECDKIRKFGYPKSLGELES
jgi:hypothetical protein